MSLYIVLAVLAGETEVLINEEFAEARVASSEDGETDDDTEGNQFSRNLSELSQTLGNGMRALILLGKTHHALRRHHS